jgi:carbonic anhydrase
VQKLFAKNRAWSAQMETRAPGFFAVLAQQQLPQYLWVGCADSRVPANQIVGLVPGEVFVHRKRKPFRRRLRRCERAFG